MTLPQNLEYEFRDPSLLAHSLTHRSWVAENPDGSDNERLEFLGDAVLQMVVTGYLFDQYPDMPEGQMAKVRAACVSREELAEVAVRIGLGRSIRLGRGEEASGGRHKPSILADTMEAVIAAMYLDGGLDAAGPFILRHWSDTVRQRAINPGRRDYKTRLQEVLALEGASPTYELEESGPDHDKTFRATVLVEDRKLGEGVGGSKKEAEQAAAGQALSRMTGA